MYRVSVSHDLNVMALAMRALAIPLGDLMPVPALLRCESESCTRLLSDLVVIGLR